MILTIYNLKKKILKEENFKHIIYDLIRYMNLFDKKIPNS